MTSLTPDFINIQCTKHHEVGCCNNAPGRRLVGVHEWLRHNSIVNDKHQHQYHEHNEVFQLHNNTSWWITGTLCGVPLKVYDRKSTAKLWLGASWEVQRFWLDKYTGLLISGWSSGNGGVTKAMRNEWHGSACDRAQDCVYKVERSNSCMNGLKYGHKHNDDDDDDERSKLQV